MSEPKALGLTELVFRDAHQSLLATRLRIEDMLPIAEKLDAIGYHSLEVWGGATFDSCIRFLGEDPWERLRRLKKAMPNTPLQMLLRGQNLLGYRHYADDVVEAFVERAAANGMDVFRIFDAMNDVRNLQKAVESTLKVGRHAQGTISYTVSPVHTLEGWVTLAKQIEDLGCQSICIKDMAGLLRPSVGFELVSRLKEAVSVPLALHSHATTGMSTATILKVVEAGIDSVDTAISSMSMTTGHSPTESVVAILEGGPRDTGLKLEKLEEIASYFRPVRARYAKFEGSLRGVDSRILIAQVPGGMLTNMENQLRRQGAADRMDEVLAEIPQVRADLGNIALVTPTSQIVGTQAVLNVLAGRYQSITKEAAGILKGEYGSTPMPVNPELQKRVLEDGGEVISCRPADLLEPEMHRIQAELEDLAGKNGFALANQKVDDVLTYALFPQVGLKFFENRGNPAAFEPAPGAEEKSEAKPAAAPAAKAASTPKSDGPERYSVKVNGRVYEVEVAPSGEVVKTTPAAEAPAAEAPQGRAFEAPLAGNILRLVAREGAQLEAGDVILMIEAMKMEMPVKAPQAMVIGTLLVKEGDSVEVGDPLLTLGEANHAAAL